MEAVTVEGLSTVPGTEKASNERYIYIHRLPLFKSHYLPTHHCIHFPTIHSVSLQPPTQSSPRPSSVPKVSLPVTFSPTFTSAHFETLQLVLNYIQYSVEECMIKC